MPKNILIFSDGTGQAGGLTPDQNISNIYKFYRATRCGPENNIDPSRQLTFYDPGLGSQPDSGLFFVTRAYRWLHDVVSQATGLGITTNIIDCYAALVRMFSFRPQGVLCRLLGRRRQLLAWFPSSLRSV
jgi:uncharacterized protein (DUF2235 family)